MMMYRAFLCALSFFIVSIPVFGNDYFYELNSDLRRVGAEELKKMGEVEFEAGNYRLDPDFRVGYGDSLQIRFWGKLQATHILAVDREGDIVIPHIGKIGVMGLTLQEVRFAIQRALERKYSNVEFDCTLLDVKDIRITILGNVNTPGPYAVSPFSRMIEAIARAGGPTTNGSFSGIQLRREGRREVSFNIYDFILRAEQANNVRVKHGDVIYIPPVTTLVAIRGDVRYPGIYDVVEATRLRELISQVGGMNPTKFKRKISVLRINPGNKLTEVFKEVIFDPREGLAEKDNVYLEHYDTVIVTTELNYTPYPKDLFKVVHVAGEVAIPGDYFIQEGETLQSLLRQAGGLKKTAFPQGAVFRRPSIAIEEKSLLDEFVRAQERALLQEEAQLAGAILPEEERMMRQKMIQARREALRLLASRKPEGRIVINLEEIIKGKSDIVLEKGDRLYVPPVPDWVLVMGAVYRSQAIAYKRGAALSYYLNAVGGPMQCADKDDIYVIKADGGVESKAAGYGKVLQGDIIVVPERKE